MTQATWTISELSREFGITTRTLRFYEDQGIVSPARDGRRRIYAPRDRARLKLALRGRRLGLPLAEIVSLINLYDHSSTSSTNQLRHYAQVLSTHRQKLEQQRRDLDETLREISRQLDDCEAQLAARDEAGHRAVPADCSVPDESEPLASGEVGTQRSMDGADAKFRHQDFHD